MPLQREIRRYLKRMRRRKYKRRRRLTACLFCAVLAYLLAAKGAGEAFAVWEGQAVEYTLPIARSGGDSSFRIELRLREGEIRFFHERTGAVIP